jgi:hypothetical protein
MCPRVNERFDVKDKNVRTNALARTSQPHHYGLAGGYRRPTTN